jgi:hypothetical protein
MRRLFLIVTAAATIAAPVGALIDPADVGLPFGNANHYLGGTTP